MKRLIIQLIFLYGILSAYAQTITDPIKLSKVKIINFMDDPYWSNWGAKANYMDSGDVMIEGYESLYGIDISTPETIDTKVNFRLGFYQNRELKELTDTFSMVVNRKTFNNTLVPILVKVPQGEYDIRGLLKLPNEDTWKVIMSEDAGLDVKYQKFTVFEEPKAPFCKDFIYEWMFPGQLTSDNRFLIGEPFNLKTFLINPTGRKLKGHIKVVFERNYRRVLRRENTNQEPELQDMCVDLSEPIAVELEAGQRKRIILPCKLEKMVNYRNYWSPSCLMYYKAEGTDSWEQVPPYLDGYLTDGNLRTGKNYIDANFYDNMRRAEDIKHDIKIKHIASERKIEIIGVDADTYVGGNQEAPFCDIVNTDDQQFQYFEKGGKTITFTYHSTTHILFLAFRGKINRNVKLYL